MAFVYNIVFTKEEILQLILKEYILLGITCFFCVIYLYFKIKLKNVKLIDFNVSNNISFKFTIIIFLIFQIIDFYYENGFIGMISQWFTYWIMGIMSIVIINLINMYKNYKYFQGK